MRALAVQDWCIPNVWIALPEVSPAQYPSEPINALHHKVYSAIRTAMYAATLMYRMIQKWLEPPHKCKRSLLIGDPHNPPMYRPFPKVVNDGASRR